MPLATYSHHELVDAGHVYLHAEFLGMPSEAAMQKIATRFKVSRDSLEAYRTSSPDVWRVYLGPEKEDGPVSKCGECGLPLTVVRPGKHQCDHCENEAFYRGQWQQAWELAGELIASIRANHLSRAFATCSHEDLEEWLKPRVEKLNELRPS